jgi:hypothetical protein
VELGYAQVVQEETLMPQQEHFTPAGASVTSTFEYTLTATAPCTNDVSGYGNCKSATYSRN